METPNDIKIDANRALTYHRGDATGRVRADGWIWKQCTGTAAAAEVTFTFDDTIPAGSYVAGVAVINTDALMTAATTVALGFSGTTGAFMTASNFSSTMNAATAKATTVIPYYVATAKTPVVTFSADLDTGAKVLCGIHYRPLPAIV